MDPYGKYYKGLFPILHLRKEFFVILRLGKLFSEPDQPLILIKESHHATKHCNFLHLSFIEKKLVVACSRLLNINCWINPLISVISIKVKLHISGSFEFFINKVVHSGFSAHKSRSDNCKASALFTISCCSQKLFC